ncbi:MAG: YibE/F family protein [Candidatus Faecousia sp.]|nr:YibE/F family protein [Bacillota bacterium]MDY4218967.1 YibE/F family protein [Candidatus Faecousia sp.]
MKQQKTRPQAGWFRKNWAALLALALAIAIFAGLYGYAHAGSGSAREKGEEYAEYETGRVISITADSCEPDPAADNAYRGNQTLIVEVTSGQYKGQQLLTDNAVGPLYGEPAEVGDRVTLIISTYADGTLRSSLYEYDRSTAIYCILAAFVLVTVLVGGKTGVKSILGLVFTVGALLLLLVPLLLKGWPTVPTTFLLCAFVAVVSFVILGGVSRKILCACLGTVAGMALAALFGLLAQRLAHIDGLRITDVEPLLQLRQTGTPIGLRGLLSAGIIISALGAVMDVAMSVSSALSELKAVNQDLTWRELWRSGMNIGRDMVGTMTNTLILAFLGSGFTLMIYLYSLNLPFHELMSSSYLSLELISGVASAIGVILSVPLTAILGALLFGRRK